MKKELEELALKKVQEANDELIKKEFVEKKQKPSLSDERSLEIKEVEEIEDIVREFDDELYSSENSKSIRCLIKDIKSGKLHPYWYNWNTILNMILKALQLKEAKNKKHLQELKKDLKEEMREITRLNKIKIYDEIINDTIDKIFKEKLGDLI